MAAARVTTIGQRILRSLKRGPLTNHQLSELLRKSPDAIRDALTRLMRKGVVRHQGLTRPRVYELAGEDDV